MANPVARAILCTKPRLTGGAFLLGGIIASSDLVHVYKTGATMLQNDVYYTPVMLLVGFATLIEPRILLAYFADQEHPVESRYKWMAYGIVALGIGVSLYLRLAMFREWKPVDYSGR